MHLENVGAYRSDADEVVFGLNDFDDATIGPQFQGGPLLDSNGQAVGVLSRTYAPLAFPVADVWFAVPPSAACASRWAACS